MPPAASLTSRLHAVKGHLMPQKQASRGLQGWEWRKRRHPLSTKRTNFAGFERSSRLLSRQEAHNRRSKVGMHSGKRLPSDFGNSLARREFRNAPTQPIPHGGVNAQGGLGFPRLASTQPSPAPCRTPQRPTPTRAIAQSLAQQKTGPPRKEYH